MSVKLKLQPFSAVKSLTKDVGFVITGLDKDKVYKISFENATHNREIDVNSVDHGNIIEKNIYASKVGEIQGKINLNVFESDSASVISIYANIYERVDTKFNLTDIAAFAFQIQSDAKAGEGDKVSVYPPFVQQNDKATIRVKTTPNSNLQVAINNKRFLVKSNYAGEGSISFRAIDVLTGTSQSSESLQKFAVTYSKQKDNYSQQYDSGVFLHFVPQGMKALQATNDVGTPSCAIIDPAPGAGLVLNKVDDYCVDSAVVGDMSIFDSSSNFYNSKVGYCSDIEEVYPKTSTEPCRIYNSTSVAYLSNGTGLAVFSSQLNSTTNINAASRVFVSRLPSTLKYKGNVVRDGTIIKPYQYYHTLTPSKVAVGQIYTLTFRLTDSVVFDIAYQSLHGTVRDVVSAFVALINSDSRIVENKIKAVDQGTYFEVKSNTKFTIRTQVTGTGVFDSSLRSGATLELLCDSSAIQDAGNTVVFLSPQIGYQYNTIHSRDTTNNIIYINMPDGYNNDVGPIISDNYYCQKFVVVDATATLASISPTISNPLPAIYDIYNREVSCVYPVIATCKKADASGNLVDFVYVVCQAPVNGIYQIFYYSFIYGQDPINTEWKQITENSENKNPKIRCDSAGNLHMIWESDRSGASQLYYTCLGSASKSMNNKTYISMLEKNIISGSNISLTSIEEPAYGIQSNWVRILDNNGKASIYDKTYIAIQGESTEDTAMAYYKFYRDEYGNEFAPNFNQLSYQLSFDLKMPMPSTGIYDDDAIKAQYEVWKSSFIPVGDFKYEKDNNVYTLDGYTPYFNNFIPICGSFKLGTSNIQTYAGGSAVSGVAHNSSNVYGKFNEAISLTDPSNMRHFMLGLVPEKMRFKAKNTETFAQYCERNGVSVGSCDGFNNEIDYELATGRYKLALLLSTSDNQSSGKLVEKKYIIHRLIDGYVDFNDKRNLKIAVHYNKMSSDYIDSVLSKDKNAIADEIRYQGDVIITYENNIVCAENFLADFSDQYRQFDILLGLPYGQGFEINESVPYKGNNYEAGTIKQTFANIAVSPHTIMPNEDYITLSKTDRNTSQIVVPDAINNVLGNSSFEETTIPFETETTLDTGSSAITGWTVGYGCIYRRSPNRYGTNGSVVATEQTGLRPSDGYSWVELTGNYDGSVYNYGYIQQNITTAIGETYYVYFDVSNHPSSYLQGTSVTKKVMVFSNSASRIYSVTLDSTSVSAMNWRTYLYKFTATSTTTTIKFMNVSNQFSSGKDIAYGPQLDNIRIVASSNIDDETSSYSTWESSLIDEFEFNSNFTLNATNFVSQLPITLSEDRQSVNADFVIDALDKMHVAYQSNRDDYWNIYYTSTRYQDDPFKFDTQISNAQSNSINPSINIDSKGRRLVAWQDNREGNYQIYSALCKDQDDMLLDRCKQDEVDAFIFSYNNSLDTYSDPYATGTSELRCDMKFIFVATESNTYHFNVNFYEDSAYTQLYKKISSKLDINGWKVDGVPLGYDGFSATNGGQYEITYTPSEDDGVTGRVFYVTVEFEINTSFIDLLTSTNVQILQAFDGLDLRTSRLEDSTNFKVILESDDRSPRKIPTQTISQLNVGKINGVVFDSPLTQLPGVDIGDKVQSILVHYDAVGAIGSSDCVITFNKPIIALILNGYDLSITNSIFGNPGIIYGNQSGTGIETGDYLQISADRKTLTFYSQVNPAVDQIRVLLESNATVAGQNQLVYYCPSQQSARCDVKCQFVNNETTDQNVHFRVTFYANPEKTDVILSTFTKFDNLNWLIGNSEQFPTSGLTVGPSQAINVIYAPEVLPFDLYDSQVATTYSSNNIIRQPLLCGLTYTCVIESYRNNQFFVESEFEFICPCKKINDDRWGINHDESTWLSSGGGFDDYRISLTDNQCLHPKVNVTVDNKFYITWQDFRYSRLLENQQAVSPDYYLAIYDANTDAFSSSGQGDYDRSIISYAKTSLNIFDASIYLDAYQNINIVGHDGTKLYWQGCSFGCKYKPQLPTRQPCMFTDDTDNSLFDIGGSPDRAIDQYQKIRILSKYIAYSTYLDLQKPISVINDCFVELDIIGVPGTYAYRLKNEDSEEWSEWLPIGPDLPEQPLTASEKTDSDTQNQAKLDEIYNEQKFFRAYFIGKDRFIAPWITSSSNGSKRVCCEILTFFGKTEMFCVDFMAIYNDLEYKIDLYFDAAFERALPVYKNVKVASTSKTATQITDSNMISMSETPESVSTIYVRIEFKDKEKIALLERLQTLKKYSQQKMTMNVYQQGINDQLNLNVTKVTDGVYKSSFAISNEDGVLNKDGLALITLNIPNACNNYALQDYVTKINSLLSSNVFDQKVSIYNNYTTFREKYKADDVKASFGNFDYYKKANFGLAEVQNNSTWLGGGDGVVTNDLGFDGSGGAGTANANSTDNVINPRSFETSSDSGNYDSLTNNYGNFNDISGDNKFQTPSGG